MTYAQDLAALDHATPVIHECELALNRHTIALDNINPSTDFIWPTHQMMNRLGMRIVAGESLCGRPFVVVDCSDMAGFARNAAEAKARMVAEAYGMRVHV